MTVKTMFSCAMALAAFCFGAPAMAQDKLSPDRHVTIIVPFPAGSATDIVARRVAEGLRVAFGNNFLVENKAGADGIIAARAVQTSAPDGHTLFITTNTTHSANPNIYNQLPYDPQKDFTPLGGIIKISYMMAVRADFPASDLQGFLKTAREAKQPLTYGSANTGSRAAGELLKTRMGIDMQNVPYRGSPQALNDLVTGSIDVFFPDPASALGLLSENRFKIIGTTGAARIGSLPQVPTLMELGVPDYNISAWVGMFAPAGLPKPLQDRYNSVLREIIAQPETQKFVASVGSDPFPSTPEELAAFIVDDTRRWKEIVEVAKIEKK